MRVQAGHSEWDDVFPPSNIKIKFDANDERDPVELTIHELIHIVIHPMTLGHFDETLDEVIVDALTQYVFLYVKKNQARMKQWQKLIQKKLKESDDLVPVPYEDFVKRSD